MQDEMCSNYDADTVDALVEQLNRLNDWLESHDSSLPPTEQTMHKNRAMTITVIALCVVLFE